MTKIDIEQIKADRKAGTKGKWGRGWDDGQIVVITQGGFEGDDVVSDPMILQADQDRIARVPDMEDALIEAKAAFDAIVQRSHVDPLGSSKVIGMRKIAEEFLERFQ